MSPFLPHGKPHACVHEHRAPEVPSGARRGSGRLCHVRCGLCVCVGAGQPPLRPAGPKARTCCPLSQRGAPKGSSKGSIEKKMKLRSQLKEQRASKSDLSETIGINPGGPEWPPLDICSVQRGYVYDLFATICARKPTKEPLRRSCLSETCSATVPDSIKLVSTTGSLRS